MQTIAEIKEAVKNGQTVNWHNGSYTVIVDKHEQFLIKHSGGHCVGLTDEYKPADFYAEETPQQRLEYLREELRAERLSYDETIELQNLAPYIDKHDVELREAAGLPEFEEETPDLFETPELIPDNVRAVFEKYDNGDELSYEEIFKLHTEVEQLGYTFDYYLDAVPYDLRKIETN